MRRSDLAMLLAAIMLLPAASQSVPVDRLAQARDIPVEEWRDMAMGRTLTYRFNGELWAYEHYFPGTNAVVLQLYDGTCMQGTWDYHAPLYCFHWEGQTPSCFRHTRLGSEILIIETLEGQDTAMTQEMTGVGDQPVSCGPPITS